MQKKQTTATEADRAQVQPFDLRDTPWIPVIRSDGRSDDIGLRLVLKEAHDIREVRDPLPIVEFGLYRLLVALVLDIFRPTSVDDLEELLGSGMFAGERVDEYFDQECADCFDLFHPERPFLQSADMDKEKRKPLAGLFPVWPSGTNVNHFHHAHETAFGVCPAAAARLLTTIAPFMTAGGSGLSPSINGAPPWYVLIRGRNLFETLCLNTPVMESLFPQADDDQPPAWRSREPVEATRRTGASLVESLTWRPRRIRLLPDGPGTCALTGCDTPTLVREMKFTAGFKAGFEWTDPNVAYRITEKSRTVLRPTEGRAVWRDKAPLAFLRERDYQSERGKVRFERPAIITQFAELVNYEAVEASQPLDLTLYGMRTDLNMKVFEWYRESLSLPAPLLWKGQFRALAQQEMERTESVAYALQQAIKKAYPRGGAGNKAAFRTRVRIAHTDFWNALRPHYDDLLARLAPLAPDDLEGAGAACEKWRAEVRTAGQQALDAAIDDLDADADALERQTEARRSFAKAVSVLLQPKQAGKVRKARKKKTGKDGNS